MLAETAGYVVKVVLELFIMAVLLRFYAQALRASFRNPIADFVLALTDWAVKPLRRVVPGLMGLDLASFLVAWIVAMALYLILALLATRANIAAPQFWPMLAVMAMVILIKLSLYLLLAVVLVQALLSWTNPYHPIRPFFESLSRPFLRPIQRIVPLVGAVDLSPFILLIVIQVLLMLPVAYLETAVARLF